VCFVFRHVGVGDPRRDAFECPVTLRADRENVVSAM
jgi:hypothetical protein